MRRANITAALFLGVILFLTIFSFLNINRRFISFLNSSLEQQATLCGNFMEAELSSFESDMNKLLFDYNFSAFFNDNAELEKSQQSLLFFYSKYRDLIKNVFIFDNKRNYYGLYINDQDEFVIDIFPRQRQQQLIPRVKIEQKNSTYLYHYPYFDNDQVIGNIIVEIEFNQFAEKIFSFYPKGKTITWQWVVDANAKILSPDFPDHMGVEGLSQIADSIDSYSYGLIKHAFIDSSGKKLKVNSAYYPMSVFNQNLGIIFTASQSDFNRFFIHQNMLVSLLTFIITLALIVYLLIIVGQRTKRLKRLKTSELAFKELIEKFPIGIIVHDSGNIIRNINLAARRMMFFDENKNFIGEDISKQLLKSNKYLLKENTELPDGTEYLLFEKEGFETVIFRLKKTSKIGKENLSMIALTDVSSIERSRKQEAAANRAKSDFLAAMSHEIRTPMNGILGTVSSLLESDFKKSDLEKINIIKKSSDLLMTVINDILDFAKIAAGKMMLEEIPFQLRNEINLVKDLFKSSAEEKGLTIETEIDTSVREKLLGDPFRLRQVISNLLSNGIKFTEKGKIVLRVKEIESVKGRLQLLFSIEDSGIGIPKNKIDTLFRNYTQVQGSVTRKYGGTGLGLAISKQLVELMNGEIWVESPSDLAISEDFPGSKFSFTIEVYSDEKNVKQYNFESIHSLNQITAIYLTKDPKPERNSINKILLNFGINIETKIYQDSTIDTVIYHIKTKKELYQLLIISDKINIDGFAIANRLHEENLISDLPAIIISSNDQQGNFKKSKMLGIDYYLIDPIESKEVFDIIIDIFPSLKDSSAIKSTLNALPVKLSILLVEDNIMNQKVVQSIFKNLGYEIEMVSNGIEAIRKISVKEYDIIFMDLFMPEQDGFETTEIIRKKNIKTPIIAMSADNSDERKAESVIVGMDGYLSKPVRLETIKELLIKMFSTKIN